MAAQKLSVVLVAEKECKGSVRYSLPESASEQERAHAAVSNVYLNRAPFPQGMPKEIEVSITAK